jgi:GNAT superfamily N-acetyltransferase
MPSGRLPAIALLEPSAADDAPLVERLAALVNDVYAVAERGLWRDGVRRTSAPDIAALIRAGELAIARRGAVPAGCVRVREVAPATSEFGMLVAAPQERGTGVGRALLRFAEQAGRARGARTMQLELLVPREGSHPEKVRLKAWYGRCGYRRVRTVSIEAAYPALSPLLAVPCALEVLQKPLPSPRVPAAHT